MCTPVTEFARKTGDLRSLSTTDIRLAALVYTLENELVGSDHIRTEPSDKVSVLVLVLVLVLVFILVLAVRLSMQTWKKISKP